MDTTDLGDTDGSSRRRFLRAGLTGAVLSAALPLLARPAAGAPATTPTTVPPQRPTNDDLAILVFAESVELTARDLYDATLAAGGFDDDTTRVLETFGRHHRAYAEAIAGLLGRAASNTRDDALYAALEPAFTSSSTALEAAYELEDVAVATHTELLASLQGTDGAALIASILIVEAQHATVLANLAGIDDLDLLLSTQGEPLPPPAADADATDEDDDETE